MKLFLCLGVACVLAVAGCGSDSSVSPTAPSSQISLVPSAGPGGGGRPAPGKPGYEEAYVAGRTVTINAIELSQVAPEKAQADLYEVVYPNGWADLGLAPPQCNPCDHEHNGIDPTDYHDHVLDSMPAVPGHGEYRALWHVYVVVPAYGSDSAHNDQVSQAYAAHLPAKSETAVDALLGDSLPDGSPIAVEVDTNFYFLCAVVNPHAAG